MREERKWAQKKEREKESFTGGSATCLRVSEGGREKGAKKQKETVEPYLIENWQTFYTQRDILFFKEVTESRAKNTVPDWFL